VATPTQTTQTAETGPLKIRLRRAILFRITQAAVEKKLRVEAYTVEVLESHAATLHAQKIRPLPLPPPGAPAAAATPGTNGHRRPELSAEEIQKIIFLREDEGLTVQAIGERMHRSESTVTRILRQREQSAIRVPPAPRPHAHGQRWGKNLPARKTEA
jgi:DNA-binding NarL/FixJ family response regulator